MQEYNIKQYNHGYQDGAKKSEQTIRILVNHIRAGLEEGDPVLYQEQTIQLLKEYL